MACGGDYSPASLASNTCTSIRDNLIVTLIDPPTRPTSAALILGSWFLMFVLNVSDKSEGLIVWSVNSYYSPVMTCLTVQCPSARQGFRWSDQIRGDGEFACQTNDDNCIRDSGSHGLSSCRRRVLANRAGIFNWTDCPPLIRRSLRSWDKTWNCLQASDENNKVRIKPKSTYESIRPL